MRSKRSLDNEKKREVRINTVESHEMRSKRLFVNIKRREAKKQIVESYGVFNSVISDLITSKPP